MMQSPNLTEYKRLIGLQGVAAVELRITADPFQLSREERELVFSIVDAVEKFYANRPGKQANG